MTMSRRRIIPLMSSALVASALVAAPPGGAQSGSKPQPTPCAGLAFTDPAGDQKVSVGLATVGGQQIPPPSPQKAKDNMDLRSGFFRYAPDASGAPVLTANLQVTNLTKDLEQGANGASWYMYFGVDEATRFVRADLTGGNVTYSYGTLGGSAGPGNNREGETTGSFIEGTDGMVSIVVPDAMEVDGKTLVSPNGQAKLSFRTPTGAGAVPTADTAPDDGVGKDFPAQVCAEGETAVRATPSPTPANDRGAGTTGGSGSGGGEGSGPGASTRSAANALKLRVIAGRISARKAKRRLTVRLLPGEPITGLRATLYTGSAGKPKVFATGKLKRVAKATRIRLRVKRKLRPGAYTLAFTGRNAAGISTVAVQLRVAR